MKFEIEDITVYGEGPFMKKHLSNTKIAKSKLLLIRDAEKIKYPTRHTFLGQKLVSSILQLTVRGISTNHFSKSGSLTIFSS